MDQFLETFSTLRGHSESARPFFDDDEIINFVKKFNITVVWESPTCPQEEAHMGYCAEGAFLYDYRHKVWKPDFLGHEYHFTRWDWCSNISPWGTSGMVFGASIRWNLLPNWVAAAFRCKVLRIFGSLEEMPGAYKRQFPTNNGIQQVHFKHYA